MDTSNLIRLILVGTCLLSGLNFIFWAMVKKNKRTRNFRIAGLSVLVMLLGNFSIIKFQNYVFKPTNKISQLKFLAFGNASSGEEGWLGLYEDSTWEFGESYREIKEDGTYIITGDTVMLTSSIRNADHFKNIILFTNNQTTKSSNSTIDGLRIKLNKLN